MWNKIFKIRYLIVLIVVIAIIAILIVVSRYMVSRSEKSIDVDKGRIERLASMVELCSVEIYNEMPVVDTVHNKVIFAIQKQRGSISFNMENLQADMSGDTIRVILPPEVVKLRESTDNNSWRVIDTKATGPFSLIRRNKISLEEENAVKRKVIKRSVKALYENGTVARARAEGAHNLKMLLENIYRKPVEIIDYSPEGSSRP